MQFINLNLTFNRTLTLSCPGTGGAVVKIGHSNLWPGSKELIKFRKSDIEHPVYFCCIFYLVYGSVKAYIAKIFTVHENFVRMSTLMSYHLPKVLTLSCPGTGRAIVKMGHSNLRPGSKELREPWIPQNGKNGTKWGI